MRTLGILAVFGLVGCASQPRIIPAGNDTYLAAGSGSFYTPLIDVKARVLSQAGRYCDQEKRTFEILDSTQSQPPYIVGNNPSVEVHFRCIDRLPDPQ